MSPFEDPEDVDARFSWHYRREYDMFRTKYQTLEKRKRLKKSILKNQETYTIVTPKNATIFEQVLSAWHKSSLKRLPLFNKIFLSIKYLSCYLNAWLLF